MPEDEKEKAEKIAAAKKRYEQLKKQKAKKTPAKVKADEKATKAKTDVELEAADEPSAETDNKQDGMQDDDTAEDPKKTEDVEPSKSHSRQPSLSQQSRIRSSSFRAGLKDDAASPTAKSPTLRSGPLSPAADAADVYRKQSLRIEELEKENKSLQKDTAKLRALEEEVEELREVKSDSTAVKAKVTEVESLQTELAALKRQNTQLTQQLGSKKPRQESTSSPDTALKADLASKSATIEALELEISSANARLANLETKDRDSSAQIQRLESQVDEATAAGSSTSRELSDLKARLASQASAEPDAKNDTRLIELESSLAAAKRTTQDAEARAEKLNQKISTLNNLHREAETRHAGTLAEAQKSERETKELRTRLTALQTETSRLRDEAARRARIEASGDADGLEEIEDEERLRLTHRVRELEEENFDLRRGVWRDARKSMQPGPDGGHDDYDDDNAVPGGFDDVDLSASTRDRGPASPRGMQRNHSTFADVINSGISAFTAAPTQARQMSVNAEGGGGLGDDDDFNFDEDAFKRAHEEEAKARLERVREVKRGLPKWLGWRVDLADLRAGMGGVFDV